MSKPDPVQRYLAAQHAVTRALVEAGGVEDAFRRVLRQVADHLGWDVAVAWREASDGKLEPFALWSARPEEGFERLTLATHFAPGIDLPGRVWVSGRPEWVTDLADDPALPRAAAAAQRGLVTACALPVRVGARVVAILEFFCGTRAEPDPSLIETMSVIAEQLALRARRGEADRLLGEQRNRLEQSAAELRGTVEELKRRRAEAEQAQVQAEQAQAVAERAQAAAEAARAEAEAARAEAERARENLLKGARWASFLSEASRALATALDRDDALRILGGLSVPTIADLCAIDIVQDDGSLRRVETMRAADDLAEVEGEGDLGRVRAAAVVPVIRTGEARLIEWVGEADLRAFARDEAHLRELQALGLRSIMIVPLIARGRTLGAMTLATARSDRRYDASDLVSAESLLDRAALAVDNAALYEQALVANRAKGNFLAIMSHELRTPLTAIMGYTDILEAGIAGSLAPRQAKYLERIMVSARHLLSLIDEILTFSRLEVGRERTRYVRVPLREFTRETANLVRPAMRDRRLDFAVNLPPEDDWAETDPEKLRQVLLDLLLNAVKFTPRGRVSFGARAEDGSVFFDVQDTGIGIERGDVERIFDPFWQAEDAMTRREGGTGIGLSVARRLVHLLGGDIEVRSTPGSGTLFTVRIPQRSAATGEAAA